MPGENGRLRVVWNQNASMLMDLCLAGFAIRGLGKVVDWPSKGPLVRDPILKNLEQNRLGQIFRGKRDNQRQCH